MQTMELTDAEIALIERRRRQEEKKRSIDALFSWVAPPVEPRGGQCFQRTAGFYDRMARNIIQAIELYEPWILTSFDAYKDGIRMEWAVRNGSLLARILDDADSPLRNWQWIASCICPVCYRQWDQPYSANRCTHTDKEPS